MALRQRARDRSGTPHPGLDPGEEYSAPQYCGEPGPLGCAKEFSHELQFDNDIHRFSSDA